MNIFHHAFGPLVLEMSSDGVPCLVITLADLTFLVYKASSMSLIASQKPFFSIMEAMHQVPSFEQLNLPWTCSRHSLRALPRSSPLSSNNLKEDVVSRCLVQG